jgi:hypothetical protein
VPVPISQQLDFQLHLIVVFLMFINLRWEMIVCYVYIDGIIDHHLKISFS